MFHWTDFGQILVLRGLWDLYYKLLSKFNFTSYVSKYSPYITLSSNQNNRNRFLEIHGPLKYATFI
jgi:hypothetical protein